MVEVPEKQPCPWVSTSSMFWTVAGICFRFPTYTVIYILAIYLLYIHWLGQYRTSLNYSINVFPVFSTGDPSISTAYGIHRKKVFKNSMTLGLGASVKKSHQCVFGASQTPTSRNYLSLPAIRPRLRQISQNPCSASRNNDLLNMI